MRVSATFTLGAGRQVTLAVPGQLSRASLGEVGQGDQIVLPDLTVIEVTGGVFFGDDDPHSDPPDGDWNGKVTIPGQGGSRRRLPYHTEVWRVSG